MNPCAPNPAGVLAPGSALERSALRGWFASLGSARTTPPAALPEREGAVIPLRHDESAPELASTAAHRGDDPSPTSAA